MSIRRVAAVLALVVVASVTTGCEYLLGYDPTTPFAPFPLDPEASFDPDASFDPSFGMTPIATYATGTASLAIDDGAPVTLDRLSAGPHVFELLGADVSWSDGTGWNLRVAVPPGGLDPMIMLDRIVDGHHWTAWAGFDSCKTTTTKPGDATGLAGTATCTGLRWTDALASGSMSMDPAYVEGQAPFDARITFEAAPATST